uniref:Cytosolic protein n=1 Tax=Heterorhabditis bacteriophora TaxID=37862 RepID=A0A1I7WQ12_HETBA
MRNEKKCLDDIKVIDKIPFLDSEEDEADLRLSSSLGDKCGVCGAEKVY